MDEQKKEIAVLYRRLAKRWDWPLPATWIGDRETVMNDIDKALICLRGLVADQCPLPYRGEHWANMPESAARVTA